MCSESIVSEACRGLLRYSLTHDFHNKGYTWRMSGSDINRFDGADWTLMGIISEIDGKLVVRHAYIGDAGILAHVEYPAKLLEDGSIGYSPFGKSLQ